MREHAIAFPLFHCLRCGHYWPPRVPQPQSCPRCKSRYWNRHDDTSGTEGQPPDLPKVRDKSLKRRGGESAG